MWFWRRFFSFSVLTVSFGLGLDLDSNLFGLGLDSDSNLFGLGLDSDSNLFGLGLDSDSNLFGLGLDSYSNLFGLGLVLDSTKVDLTTALQINSEFKSILYTDVKYSTLQMHLARTVLPQQCYVEKWRSCRIDQSKNTCSKLAQKGNVYK